MIYSRLGILRPKSSICNVIVLLIRRMTGGANDLRVIICYKTVCIDCMRKLHIPVTSCHIITLTVYIVLHFAKSITPPHPPLYYVPLLFSLPYLISHPSKVPEINKPPEWLNTGFTVFKSLALVMLVGHTYEM